MSGEESAIRLLLVYRQSVRCLYCRIIFIMRQSIAIGSTVMFSTNENDDSLINFPNIERSLYKIGKLVWAYPLSIYLTLLESS